MAAYAARGRAKHSPPHQIILMDSKSGVAMTLGRTSLVGPRGAEPLSRASLDPLIVP